MDKTTLQSIIEIVKQNGILGLLIVVIFYYGSSFSGQLTEISKQIVQIKIELAEMNAKYIQKDAVRTMIDQQIEKLIQRYHKQNK